MSLNRRGAALALALVATLARAEPAREAIVTAQLGGAVEIVDLTAGKVVRSIALDGAPAGIALSPDRRRAYVTRPEGHGLAILDLDAGRGPVDGDAAHHRPGGQIDDLDRAAELRGDDGLPGRFGSGGGCDENEAGGEGRAAPRQAHEPFSTLAFRLARLALIQSPTPFSEASSFRSGGGSLFM